MDDREAEKQIQQMINFILNEARETSEQVTAKANEDFNIEKLKLVQNMKDKIRTEMAALKKKEETKKAIERSTSINKARLKKIEARQQCIDKLAFDVGDKLKEVAKAESKYKQILIDLIVQGSLKLMEEEVSVRCRVADQNVVRSILEQASQAFTKTVSKACNTSPRVKFTIDKDSLPVSCLGGVKLLCQGGAISVDNTLDARLKLCLDNDKPSLRKMIFPH